MKRAETIAYAKTNIGPEVFQRSMEKHGNSSAVKMALEQMQVCDALVWCAALCCAVLYCTVLYCTVMYGDTFVYLDSFNSYMKIYDAHISILPSIFFHDLPSFF